MTIFVLVIDGVRILGMLSNLGCDDKHDFHFTSKKKDINAPFMFRFTKNRSVKVVVQSILMYAFRC